MRFLTAGLLSFALGVAVAAVSGNLYPRFVHKSESAHNERAVLHREPLIIEGASIDIPEFRNRVLVGALMEFSNAIVPASPQEHFILWRFLTAWIMFLVYFQVVKGAQWEWCVIGALLLGSVLMLSFGQAWEMASDFPDVAFQLGFCALAVRGRWLSLLVLALVAATNRESAAYAGVVWACCHGFNGRVQPREIVRGAAIAAAIYGAVALLRLYYSVAPLQMQTLAFLEIPQHIRQFLSRPTLGSWPVFLLAAIALVGAALGERWPVLDGGSRRLLLAALMLAFVSLIFGQITEIRVLLPSFAIAIVALVRPASVIDLRDTLSANQARVSIPA